MNRRPNSLVAAICIFIAAPLAFAQTATATGSAPTTPSEGVSLDAYDVVSIKPVAPGGRPMIGMTYLPDGFKGGPLPVIVQQAYSSELTLQSTDSVKGLPEWTRTDMYNFEAKMSPEQAAAFAKLNPQQQKECREVMLRALLAACCKLQVHHHTEQVPGYDLVIAKGGPKVKEGGDLGPNRLKNRDGTPMDGSYITMPARDQVGYQLFTMAEFAIMLSGRAPFGTGRVVTDKTGLTGKYSFILTYTRQSLPAAAPPDEAATPPDDSAPSIFTAVQEQLGLKLEPCTATVNTVVVDHVERPTPD
jgi:uncharacterized protein (TIGR03435 family)